MTDRPRREWTDRERELERKGLELLYGSKNTKGERQTMANSYDNTNSGVLFENAEKPTDAHPDWSGNFDLNGSAFKVSVWLNRRDDGSRWLKFKFDPQEGQGAKRPQTKASREDIPF